MRDGEPVGAAPSLEQIRVHAREAIAALPVGCRALASRLVLSGHHQRRARAL